MTGMKEMKKEEQESRAPAEMLSRLMDEPLGDFELRRLLSEVEKSPEEELSQWRRYQAMRAVLRGEPLQQDSMDLTAAVRSAIAQESVPVAETRNAPAGRVGALGGLAVAASVMFAAVLLVRTVSTEPGGGAPDVAQAPAETPVVAVAPAPADVRPAQTEIIRSADVRIPQPARSPQPNVYLVRHAEFSTFAGSGAMMPYARVATSDAGN